MIFRIRQYVPGYTLLIPPTIESDRILMMVKVQGLGDYLPKYAGNMDIIKIVLRLRWQKNMLKTSEKRLMRSRHEKNLN